MSWADDNGMSDYDPEYLEVKRKENNMQPQDWTVEQAINRNKPDKFGNQTFDVKFREHPNLVYVAAKTPPKVGDTKYGTIQSNDYGERFKSEMKQDTGSTQSTRSFTPRSPQPGKKSDEERSEDIRWGLCIKEANLYVTKYRDSLNSEEWAIEVNEYANALYKLSAGPDPDKPKDEGVNMDEINDLFGQASDLPL